MKLFGLTIARTKALPANLAQPDTRGGWLPIIREGFAGAWQANITTTTADIFSHPTVYACITRIANDIAKMRCELVRETENDVWMPTESAAFSPVLRMPNSFQTPFQFFVQWLISKLSAGNTYVFMSRDARGVVTAMHVLDPFKVRPLIAPDGSVFYEVRRDDLATQPEDQIVIPAREIIHDLMNPLFHPLVGVAPLYAASIPAYMGNKILTNGAHFFANDSRPGGVIVVPGAITQPQADALLDRWVTGHTGANRGVLGILTGGMTYQSVAQTAEQSQTHEQWSDVSQAIADAFGIPWFLVGGPMPPYNNVQTLTVQYFTQCLQPHTTSMEQVTDKGLGLSPDKIGGVRLGTQFNVNDLLWMDSATMMDVISKGVGAGVLKPNEGRAQLNREPVAGGDTPYLQVQNYSLSALDKRDQAGPPVTPSAPAPAATPTAEPQVEDMAAAFEVSLTKALKVAA